MLVETVEPTVLGFQKTYLANNYHIRLTSYNAIIKQGTCNRRYHGRVAMYMQDSCPFQELKIQPLDQETANQIVLKSNSLVTVANFYIFAAYE